MADDIRILTKNFNPIKLLKIISPDDYEEIIKEWCSGYLDKKYERVERLGGSGDKGRDIVCTISKKDATWINYQCKHYDKPLQPSTAWLEIGKLIIFVYEGDYNAPQKYYFVSPCGVGTKLRDILINPEKIRSGLKNNWAKYCEKGLKAGKNYLLDKALIDFIDSFDFKIFDYLSPDDFLNEFKNTCYFTKHFGGLIKPRPLNEEYPELIQSDELIYIRKILDAYSEHLKENIGDSKELDKYPDIKLHFERQRRNFYSAEYLKAYSREIYDPDMKYFENLKNEIYDGIIDEIETDAKNGFERLKKVIKRSEQIQITNNPLTTTTGVRDRQGICHHLANEREEVKWKK